MNVSKSELVAHIRTFILATYRDYGILVVKYCKLKTTIGDGFYKIYKATIHITQRLTMRGIKHEAALKGLTKKKLQIN